MKSIIATAFVLFFVSFGSAASADKAAIYTGTFSSNGAGGYDVVAYFTDGKPVKGSRKFEMEWKDATWRFSSQDNLDSFAAEPEKYAPRYGGYCAWAMANEVIASGDPKVWKIVDGRLYLNNSKSVQERWEADIPGFISSADVNYPVLTEGPLY